ncbi:MAG: tryptophan synthase subunit alpha [Proteobacteria bacterium]|nr:tryptophan synthase subunit alpha [Pseudomonadota bacterium]
MSTRIESTFSGLKGKRAALIPFLMAFDPDRETTLAALDALVEAGADIIEIGIPFSDPMADGPVIQAAGLRALQGGATLAGVLALVAEFRRKNTHTPLILMGYYNPIYRYGAEVFCADAAKAGADGLILVDLPPEEEQELTPYLQAQGLKLIRLIAPTSLETRAKTLCESASGFVYYISVTGITGAKSANNSDLKAQLAQLRQHTKLPIAVGFGIKTPQQVKDVASMADAVVVGSALVDTMHKAGKNAAKAASDFMRQLSAGLQG